MSWMLSASSPGDTFNCVKCSSMSFIALELSINALKRYQTTYHREDCTPIEDVLPIMLVVYSPNEDGKVHTETTDVIDNYDGKGFDFISSDYPRCALW